MSNGLSGVRADHSTSYRQLEFLAARVRKELKLAPDQAIDPLQLFEDLHEISIQQSSGKLIPLGYGVISLEGSEGFTRYDRDRGVLEILASERTYDWLERRRPRAGYFVAHELGHCILHTDQLVRLAQMPTQQQAAFHRSSGRQAHQAYQDTEWQANAFASSLLMPAQGLLALEGQGARLSVEVIADTFGVSLEAAGYRLDLYGKRKSQLVRL